MESQDVHMFPLLCKMCLSIICRPEILELHNESFSRSWPFVWRFHCSWLVSPHKESVVQSLIVFLHVSVYWLVNKQ